ncbi:uncharacterized protein LOC121478493 [Vulpes lagopus]|uniref:uncharacterized protein LOC121478493 n=1 Tax=Vulpes lagopus TaxID=494514 RepID=UPI001BC949CF|nr:uncharacterized protein LOC121478493 [Vulpes lagopus]
MVVCAPSFRRVTLEKDHGELLLQGSLGRKGHSRQNGIEQGREGWGWRVRSGSPGCPHSPAASAPAPRDRVPGAEHRGRDVVRPVPPHQEGAGHPAEEVKTTGEEGASVLRQSTFRRRDSPREATPGVKTDGRGRRGDTRSTLQRARSWQGDVLCAWKSGAFRQLGQPQHRSLQDTGLSSYSSGARGAGLGLLGLSQGVSRAVASWRFQRRIPSLPFQLLEASCVQCPMSLHPHVPTSPCPHVPMFLCPHIPTSSFPHVPTSPCPHVPTSPCPHIPMFTCMSTCRAATTAPALCPPCSSALTPSRDLCGVHALRLSKIPLSILRPISSLPFILITFLCYPSPPGSEAWSIDRFQRVRTRTSSRGRYSSHSNVLLHVTSQEEIWALCWLFPSSFTGSLSLP